MVGFCCPEDRDDRPAALQVRLGSRVEFCGQLGSRQIEPSGRRNACCQNSQTGYNKQ
jgi:hypothetical protein